METFFLGDVVKEPGTRAADLHSSPNMSVAGWCGTVHLTSLASFFSVCKEEGLYIYLWALRF